MYELALHEEAEREIEDLWDEDEAAAADITVLLEELRDDQRLLRALLTHRREEESFNVSRLFHWQDFGWNVWRIKLLKPLTGALDYRLIYALDENREIIYILTLMHRDVNYERDENVKQRIVERYKELGIPRRH